MPTTPSHTTKQLPQSWTRFLALALFLLALVLAGWRLLPEAPNPAFAVASPATATPTPLPAFFVSEKLPQVAASAHAPSLAFNRQGQLLAAWFAGSREGADDVAIWLSTLTPQGWQTPRRVIDRERTAGAVWAHIRKLGNPVLFADGKGHLHLWFVSVGVGGWAGSSINHMMSTDDGENWSLPRRLVTSPFANISTLVRTPPLPLQDGGLGLPVYHEFIAKHGEWLRLSPQGEILGKSRMILPHAALQPAVVALDAQRARAFLRDASAERRVQSVITHDGGQRWQGTPSVSVPNPNSSLAALRLASGRLLMAANDDVLGRRALDLWLSDDDGDNWHFARRVEIAPASELHNSGTAAPGAGMPEFSYPALLLAPDGRIHLAYTWRRLTIRHAVFSEAWLDEPQAQAKGQS